MHRSLVRCCHTSAGVLGALTFVLSPAVGRAREYERRVYATSQAVEAPHIDGRLDETVWQQAEEGTDFVQLEPTEGAPPSQRTSFRILYDNSALYIAVRAFDTEPDKISSELARRDESPGDWVSIDIDSYHDKRTAFSFTASVSGTRSDEAVSNDGSEDDDWDDSWDPLWELATQIDELGWTAEIMIPLSQLRFTIQPDLVWGIQVTRHLFRADEDSVWQPVSPNDAGWVSRFGELHGLQGIDLPRRLELLPYVSGKAERYKGQPEDPFQDGQDGSAWVGLDGKFGLGHNLTLDFTVNPDFGQVEADPSVVNLTDFETFYSEKRPFFIEGQSILAFPVAPTVEDGDATTDDDLFYSRRIGRQPSIDPDYDDNEHATIPEYTSILGAFKLTGRTRSGLKLGLLESVTSRENATIDNLGLRRNTPVEPLTNFLLMRLQQDLQGGNSSLGGFFSATNRDLSAPELLGLHRAAYAGGLDLRHQWDDKNWNIDVSGSLSNVRGSADALIATQASAQHYFQRPDNDYESVDSTRTSLSGHAGSARFGRTGGGDWKFQLGAAWRSPGFEINDLGYLLSADEINQFAWVGYSRQDPFWIFRDLTINGNQRIDWDFGGTRLGERLNSNFTLTFRNNWTVGAGTTRTFESISNSELRGGPSFLWPGQWDAEVSIGSDSRKAVFVELGGSMTNGDLKQFRDRAVTAAVTVRPANAVRMSLEAGYERTNAELQYVDEDDFNGEPRYIFGRLHQTAVPITLRLDYTLTPGLTLQYYGSPFISAGDFTEFKRIAQPRAAEYYDRFRKYADGQLLTDADGDYEVDEDQDGESDYSFDNPDFNIKDFNSNLVLRWQFRPGSTMFLVWTQARYSESVASSLRYRNDVGDLFRLYPSNIFMVKINKWFSL
jgi:hypothetical protein